MSSAGYNLPVLVVDPEPNERTALCEMLSRQGQTVDTAPDGVSASELLGRKSYKLVLTETGLPQKDGLTLLNEVQRRPGQTPVVMLSDKVDVQQAVEAIRQGAMDYLIKPISSDSIREILDKLAEMNRAAAKIKAGKGPAVAPREIVTVSEEMKRLLEIARSVAPSTAAVLISGESGTGKELFARYIHAHSDRSDGPFVAVNCAAIPENLLESELFGHEKGAFTGAVARKPGKFELADKGTILLDEISEMDKALQAKLLRVLQENEIDRVGGRGPTKVDVRVISTTNRNLEQEVAEKYFRQDLYYRLNVIPLKISPLSERPEDIEPLAEHFLNKYAGQNNKTGLAFAPETLALLKARRWPGNVRELENIIERAVLMSCNEHIQVADLLLDAQPTQEAAKPSVAYFAGKTIKEMERGMIEATLKQTDGNRTHAAKMLGISIRTLRNKLHEYKQSIGGLDEEAAVGG